MKRLVANYHTHLKLCGHASGMSEDYVKFAIANKIKELGISDHGPIPRSWMSDEEYTICGLQKKMNEDIFKNIYLKDIDDAKEKYKDKINVYRGIEIEYIEGHDEYYENLRTDLDYMILGQHFIKYNNHYFSAYDNFDAEKIIRYTETVCKAMETGLFKIFAHPDLFMCSYVSTNGNLYEFDEICEKCTRKIIACAIKNGVYLEVNCGGVDRGLKEQFDGTYEYLYPKKGFWEIVKEYKDAKIVLGCDAHSPDRLSHRVVDECLEFFEKIGLNRVESLDINSLVEIVPNYSEGKNRRKMAKISSPFKKDCFDLIKLEMDPFYNRSVLTVIGNPRKVIEAMFLSVKYAMELIDLNIHKGEHLRIGAVDVCPFIPIKNINEKEVIAFSKRFAKEVAEKLNIPVYLYALSAMKSSHLLLPDIRKGEFENLTTKMCDPKWYPDYGDNHPHKTFGAMVVGCRKPLIAFNIDLDTNDKKIAHEISKKIRFSSGGYRGVQAREAYISEKDIMQVSTNITDFKMTSLYQVFEAVKMEARRFNVNVTASELVGMIFEKAIIDTLKYYLMIPLNEKIEFTFAEEVECLKKYLLMKNISEDKIIEYQINKNKI